jgi:hypothetical protein
MEDISNDIFYRQFIGMTLDEAIECVKLIHNSIRIVEKDGKGMVITRDFNTRRINVSVKDGQIIKLNGIG